MTSTFNPDTFLQSTYTEATDTHALLCPEGDWRAQVNKVSMRKNVKDGTEYIGMDILWEILDDEAKQQVEATGDTKLFAKQGGLVDLIEASGGVKVLDMSKGKNIMIGRNREAFGQNRPDRPWKPTDMTGQIAVVKVKHRQDPTDPEIRYAEVKGVSAL